MKIAQSDLVIKRVYEDRAPSDGLRILVDRLWPRGLSKERASVDHWFKDVAPSAELRKWFNHDPKRYEEFKSKYQAELKDNPEVDKLLAVIAEADGKTTLLYGAKNEEMNQAVVLREFLLLRTIP